VTELCLLDQAEIKKLESSVSAVAALHSPVSGIIDSHAYMTSLLQQAETLGVVYAPRTRVEAIGNGGSGFVIDASIAVRGQPGTREPYRFSAATVVNCTGLHATALAERISGVSAASIPRHHYCKGDYFSYLGRNPFQRLIYPMPEADSAGLGIHATLDLGGRVRFGPDTEYIEQAHYHIDPGKAVTFAARIRDYFPAIEAELLKPDYAGIRPKLTGPGEPAADFKIQDYREHGVPGLIQLFGIESPGLTASLAIAELVGQLAREELR
jgi:L-2-hydroxyglutarate oxidase LhgO